ncbi:TldD/PmbA family protein [Candidatus Bipolaricaulota bacterium]
MGSGRLLERCREAVSLAQRLGASAAEAFGQTIESVNSTVEKNDLQISKSQLETAIGVRAFVGHRVGFASTNSLEQLESACSDAVALAKMSPEDPHNILAEPTDIAPIDGLYDPASGGFSAGDAVKRSAEILSLTEAIDSRVLVNDAWFDVAIRDAAIVNSNGLSASERGSLFTYGLVATAREGDRVSSFDFQFDATRSVAGIDVAPPVRRACESALASLGAEKGESFKGSVLLSPGAVSQILVGLLLFQLNARNGLRGRSRWKDAVGEDVTSKELSLGDDGRLPGGVATGAFDREGVPHEELTVIAEGKLRSLLHNTYTAHATGHPNTAHATGAARSIPAIGPTNLSILPGAVPHEELIAGMSQGLLVRRFSGNVDPISGDFSGAVKAAHLIKAGKLTRPVAGTMIAGNVFEALRSLTGVSSERERVYSLTLPYVRLENVSVTAN